VRARISISLLVLLIVAPLAGFVPQTCGTRTSEPLDLRPTWAHLVVVTCDRLPADLDRDHPGIASLERRATRVALRATASAEPAVEAARLWTGRPLGASDLSAPSDEFLWSVSCAAHRAGAASAAFLERPLVSRARLAGFDRVSEEADLGPERLLALAEEHLDRDPGRRKVLWLHLADSGPRGERLAALLDGLCRAIDARGHGLDTMLLATALTAEPGSEIPMWAELPSDMFAGRQGHGSADPAELASVLLKVLRIPRPDVTLGELPVVSSPDLEILLRGGTVHSSQLD
jgi:hypothetical protein